MVRLVPMNAAQYATMYRRCVRAYADDMIRIGVWGPEEGVSRSKAELDRILPQGLETPDHYLLEMTSESGTDLGTVWVSLRKTPAGPSGFVWWFEVFPEFRGRGFGKSALLEAERILGEKGARRVGLNVFAHDTVAVALYQSLGYRAISYNFEKLLPGGREPSH